MLLFQPPVPAPAGFPLNVNAAPASYPPIMPPGMMVASQPVQTAVPLMQQQPMILPQPVSQTGVTSPPGFVFQPSFGMIPVAPDALSSGCSREIPYDATSALVDVTFRPKALSREDMDMFARYVRDKANNDLVKTAGEIAEDAKARKEKEEEFWKDICAKNFEIYFGRIGCEVVKDHEFEPEVASDESGVRVYRIEVKKRDNTPIKETLTEKAIKELNAFIQIVPAIRKEPGLPEVFFQPTIVLAEWQGEVYIKALRLTDAANKAHTRKLDAARAVEALTQPAIDAKQDLARKERGLQGAKVLYASWNKYLEMPTTTEAEKSAAIVEKDKASSAKAKAEADLRAAEEDTKQALSNLLAAKQQLLAAEFEVDNAVDAALPVRREVERLMAEPPAVLPFPA